MIRKISWAVSAVVVLAVATFLLGPRPHEEVALQPVTLPSDLDLYLEAAEDTVPDLRAHLRREIVWADPGRRRTALALVYLHGFTASRAEIHPAPDSLASRLGANLYYARLRGHGRDADAMAEASFQAWAQDAFEALEIGRRLGEQVVLVGTSTGATLALWLAAQPEARDVAALVLVSPNLRVQDAGARIILWPWGRQLLRHVAGDYAGGRQDSVFRANWTNPYHTDGLVPMMLLLEAVEAIDLSTIDAPILVALSRRDQVVRADVTLDRFAQRDPRRWRLLEMLDDEDPHHHLIAGAIRSPSTTGILVDEAERFLRSHLGPSAPR